MLKNLMFLFAVGYAATGCHHKDPQQTVEAVRQVQSAVQAVAKAAEPHVLAVVDQVVLPVVQDVARTGGGTEPLPQYQPQPSQQAPAASQVVPLTSYHHRNDGNAVYCYPHGDPSAHMTECYASPR